MGDIAHYQLHPKKAALSAALAKSGPLDFPFSCSLILFFRVARSQKYFLASTPVWTAIISGNFRFCPARSDCNNVAHGERF